MSFVLYAASGKAWSGSTCFIASSGLNRSMELVASFRHRTQRQPLELIFPRQGPLDTGS